MDSIMLSFYKTNRKMCQIFSDIMKRTCNANDLPNPLETGLLSDLFILIQLLSENMKNKDIDREAFNGRLSILAITQLWLRYGQEYVFKPQIAAAIAETEIDEIPCDVIKKAPYPTLFIRNPFPENGCEGYLVQGVSDDNGSAVDGNTIIFIKIRDKHSNVDPQAVEAFNVNPCFFIDTKTHKTFDDMLKSNGITGFFGVKEVKSVISMYTYLCCQNKEVVVKEKSVKRLLSGEKVPVTQNEVGVRYEKDTRVIYNEVSRQDGQGTTRSVSGHYRKAHYHTYLCGQGKTDRIVKWISPIIVNGGISKKAMVVVT